jgi:hypothetical protein
MSFLNLDAARTCAVQLLSHIGVSSRGPQGGVPGEVMHRQFQENFST